MRITTLHTFFGFSISLAASLFASAAIANENALDASIARSYPQACLQAMNAGAKLPATAPPLTKQMQLPSISFFESSGIDVAQQPVSLGAGRVACGGMSSAVLIRMADLSSSTSPGLVLFPSVSIVQNGVQTSVSVVSVSAGTEVLPGATRLIGKDSLFALESDDSRVDLSRAFKLWVAWPFVASAQAVSFNIPDYSPTLSTFPDAYGPRPLNGRYAGNYFDPAKIGEGVIVEIGDIPNQEGSHFLQFSWFSFDNSGKPFWISGGGNFIDGEKHLHMPAAFRGGGRFGGAKQADELTLWGTVDIEFSDCDTMLLDYSASGNFASNVPTGNGHLQLQRLTGISGYSCN